MVCEFLSKVIILVRMVIKTTFWASVKDKVKDKRYLASKTNQ